MPDLCRNGIDNGKPEEDVTAFDSGNTRDPFTQSFLHAMIQTPINGVAEIAQHVTGTELLPQCQIIAAPADAAEGSAQWHLQQLGRAGGTFVDCALLMKGLGRLGGGNKSSLMSQTFRAGLAGSIYGGIFTPTGSSGDSLIYDRLTSSATSAAAFASVHLLSSGAQNFGRSLNLGQAAEANFVARRLGAAALSAPVGLIATELDAGLHGKQATNAERLSSLYTFSLLGMVSGTPRYNEAKEPLQIRSRLDFSKQGSLRAAVAFDLLEPSARAIDTTALTADQPLSVLRDRLGTANPDTIEIRTPRMVKPGDLDSIVFESEKRAAVSYKSDRGITITLPVEYATALEPVRQYRLAVEQNPGMDARAREGLARELLGDKAHYATRALPEDFLTAVDNLPEPGLLKRLVLMDEPNPEDAVQRIRQNNSRYYSAAVAAPDGEVTFFQRHTDGEIGRHTAHEVAGHLLRYRLEGDFRSSSRALPQLFDMAVSAEGKGFLTDGRAATMPEEAWSSFVEEAIGGGEQGYKRALDRAPIRSAVFGRILADSLQTAEASGQTGAMHQVWWHRALEMQARMPVALERLANNAAGETAAGASSSDAARLFVHLANPSQLSSLSAVRKLDLSGSLTTDELVSKLSYMPWVRELDLSKARISDQGVSHLQKLPLETLTLSNTFIGDRGLRGLSGMPLQSLDLSNTRVTGAGLADLARIKTLKELNLSNTKAASDPRIGRLFPQVQVNK